jgi:hypothetical protein
MYFIVYIAHSEFIQLKKNTDFRLKLDILFNCRLEQHVSAFKTAIIRYYNLKTP